VREEDDVDDCARIRRGRVIGGSGCGKTRVTL
jgi:hypothetical protein